MPRFDDGMCGMGFCSFGRSDCRTALLSAACRLRLPPVVLCIGQSSRLTIAGLPPARPRSALYRQKRRNTSINAACAAPAALSGRRFAAILLI